jgi:penicillin-binding protein 1A
VEALGLRAGTPFASRDWVGVVIPFVPRASRPPDGGGPGAPPAGRSSPQPEPLPPGGGRPPAQFPRPPQKASRWRWRSLSRGARFLAVALAAATVLLGLSWTRCGWAGCPDVAALGAFQPGGAPVVLDRDGRPVAELAPVESQRVLLADLPPYVPRAFIAVEDRRFEKHGGIDWLRVPGAMLANVRSRRVEEGFSTITMQLARNVFPDRLPGSERTLSRKLLELRVAQDIERQFDKDEILELYLNNIYFGNGARGIEAAARHYFGKPAARLSLAEAALLAAMPKAPSRYDPRRHRARARSRRDLVLTLMEEQGLVRPREAQAAREAPVRVRRPRRVATGVGLAPYFVEQIEREAEERLGPGLYHRPWRIHTTLDARIQRAAEQELGSQLRTIESGALGRPQGRGRIQGAVVVLDAATGDVLAWVGGRDFAASRFDRVRDARRQAGSAFKPFVFAAALTAGRPLTELLEDQPLRLTLGGGRTWEPKNFEGTFQGRVTMREALVRSKNVPTIRLADSVGIEAVAQLAERAGVEPPIPREPSMPLGTVAVSPLELATAFTALARQGTAVRPRMVSRVESPEGDTIWQATTQTAEVLPAATAYLVNDVLAEALARGTGAAVRAAGFNAPAAGKTGTTNDGADAWFVGYTPDVVAAVWVGYDRPAPIVPRATGGRLAAPIWARLMLRVYQGRPHPGRWPKPPGVVEGWVDPATGMLLADGCRPAYGAAYRELFLSGHAPRASCPATGPPEPLTADILPLEGYEEFMGEPDLPPLELERSVVPEEDEGGEDAEEAGAESAAPEEPPAAASPEPPAEPPAPRVSPSTPPRRSPPARPSPRARVASPSPSPAAEPASDQGAPPRPAPTPSPLTR